jgi:hypothetical protein
LLSAPNDVVWDMMAPEYQSLRADAACYTDGHLSQAGAFLVLADIERQLNLNLKGMSQSPIFPRPGPLACLGKPGAGSGYDRTVSAAPFAGPGTS